MSKLQPNSLNLDAWLEKGGPAAFSFARLWETVWKQDYLSAEQLELCRLTLARLHGDTVEIEAANPHLSPPGLDNARRRSVLVGDALESVDFSDGEKAMLLFAEYYWMDAQSITDEVADGVKDWLGEAGLVFLIEALGCIDGRIRAARCLRGFQREAAYAA